MIKNYLKVAWRNLIKNRVHTFINIAGLSVGLTCSLLILLWVENELNMDTFHKNSAQLFSVYETIYSDHKPITNYATPGTLATELKKSFPEVEYASGMGFKNRHLFRAGDKIMKWQGCSADSDFFKMFSYPLLQGSARSALNTVSGIAISRQMAEVFFSSPQNAMGKTIRYDNNKEFTITAVFDNLPSISSQQFDFLTSWNVFLQEYPWATDMDAVGPRTFVRLRADANPDLFGKKIYHFLRKFFTDTTIEGYSGELQLQRFDQMYLHNNFTNGKIDGGRIRSVNLFSIVALVILLMASINFMNLTIARSIKRAREIGVRKVVGASRFSLIAQFIGESMLITSLAIIISLLLLIFLLPLFNQVTHKEIGLPFSHLAFWLKLFVLTLITGIISGSYPALFLSSLNTVKVLKGGFKLGGGTTLFRKGLIVFQFVLSIVLAIGTFIILRQINFIQSANIGYDRENLVSIPLEGDLATRYAVFKTEALNITGIQSLTHISDKPTEIRSTDNDINWDGKTSKAGIEFTYASVGYDFINTMKLKLLEGREFSRDFPGDTTGFMINEAALKIIGYTHPVGKRLDFLGKQGKIIGVIKDFHFSSFHANIEPLIVTYGEQDNNGFALIRIQQGKTKEALAGLESVYKQMNPNFTFTYSFTDEDYSSLYQNEQMIGKLSKAFSFLAILISCLGLWGLTIFSTEQRVKEIGIRKVLGANLWSLFSLLSSEFLVLVLLALFIAAPLAWYAMHIWMQNFAYHSPLTWWLFVLPGGFIILIALATISYQVVKATLINPIKSLRTE